MTIDQDQIARAIAQAKAERGAYIRSHAKRIAARNNSRAVVCPYRDEGDSYLLRQAWQRGYWRELACHRRAPSSGGLVALRKQASVRGGPYRRARNYVHPAAAYHRDGHPPTCRGRRILGFVRRSLEYTGRGMAPAAPPVGELSRGDYRPWPALACCR